MKRTLFTRIRSGGLLLALAWAFPVLAQNNPVLDDYIRQGLSDNLVLKQRRIELDKALNTLTEARRAFLPQVDLQGGYTSGYGGRYINLPIGNLLNPVYGTLNEMTQSRAFPRVENVETYFFPRDQYDLHVRTSMPLFNSDLLQNRKLQTQQSELKTWEVEVYKRDLVLSIKQAYYNYLMAGESLRIYRSALALVEESQKTTQALVKNGQALPVQVQRSDAEKARLSTQVLEAENQQLQARRYLNFLLNRDLNTELAADPNTEQAVAQALLAAPEASNPQQREELKILGKAEDLRQSQVRMASQFWTPKLSAFLDLGNQAEGLKVNDKSRYYLVGVNLDMPLFAAGRNRLKTQRARLDLTSAQYQTENTRKALEMSSLNAWNTLQNARSNHQAALRQNEAAQAYFRVLDKGYRAGTNSFLEWLDARSQLTQAEAQVNVARFQVLQASATLERETATYPLPH